MWIPIGYFLVLVSIMPPGLELDYLPFYNKRKASERATYYERPLLFVPI